MRRLFTVAVTTACVCAMLALAALAAPVQAEAKQQIAEANKFKSQVTSHINGRRYEEAAKSPQQLEEAVAKLKESGSRGKAVVAPFEQFIESQKKVLERHTPKEPAKTDEPGTPPPPATQQDHEVFYRGQPPAYWGNQLKEADAVLKKPRLDLKSKGKAMEALEALGPDARSVVPDLITVLNMPWHNNNPFREQVVFRSIEVLGKIGPEAKDAVPAIVKILNHRDDPKEPSFCRLHLQAAWALGQICRFQTETERTTRPDEKIVADLVVPALIDTLKDGYRVNPWYEAHILAAKSLGQIGPPAKSAVPSLIEAMVKYKSQASSEALAHFGEAAVPALVKALNDKDYGVRLMAAETLGEIGPDAKAALPALKSLSEQKSEQKEAARTYVERLPQRSRDAARTAIKKIEGGK